MSGPQKINSNTEANESSSFGGVRYILNTPLNVAYSISEGVKWGMGIDATSKNKRLQKEFKSIENQYIAASQLKDENRELLRIKKNLAAQMKASNVPRDAYKTSTVYLEYQEQKSKYLRARVEYSLLQVKYVSKARNLFDRGLLDPECELFKRILESFEKGIKRCQELDFYKQEELKSMSEKFYRNTKTTNQ